MESVERNYNDFRNLMPMGQKFCTFLGKFTQETWVLLNINIQGTSFFETMPRVSALYRLTKCSLSSNNNNETDLHTFPWYLPGS
jgi:hypothetical protein